MKNRQFTLIMWALIVIIANTEADQFMRWMWSFASLLWVVIRCLWFDKKEP